MKTEMLRLIKLELWESYKAPVKRIPSGLDMKHRLHLARPLPAFSLTVLPTPSGWTLISPSYRRDA